MRHIIFNKNNTLRNGWWVLLFIALTILTTFLYTPLSRGLQSIGVKVDWLGLLPVLFALMVSWVCTRLMKRPLSSIGLKMNRTWFNQLTLGIGLGALGVFLTVGFIWGVGGVAFSLNDNINSQMLILGLYMMATAAIYEEILFRGFVFQRLIKGIGVYSTQIILALLFAIGHWENPGMEGITRVIATLDIALAAILFGLAYLRTQSLALPIGLHFSWNWVLGQFFGFGVSGIEQQGVLIAETTNLPIWLTGGSFGPEASIFAVLVDLLFIVILWRWKGIASSPESKNNLDAAATA